MFVIHMHACCHVPARGTLNLVSMDPAGFPTIDDDRVDADQAAVRFVVVQRLHAIWNTVAPHATGTCRQDTEDSLGREPDPRMVEIGVRVLDRLTTLYRLAKPQVRTEEEAEPTDEASVTALVAASLDQLEAEAKSDG